MRRSDPTIKKVKKDGLILRANASEEIGAGHVMRLLALAQGARSVGCECHFLIGGDSRFALSKVVEAGFEVTLSLCEIGGSQDLEEVVSLAHSHGSPAVVVDGYDYDSLYFAKLASRTYVVAVDDLADRHLPVHLVVNPNYGAETLGYSVESHTKVLAGSAYALLRAEFVARCSSPPVDASIPGDRLVLTLGGSDPSNASSRLVRALGAAGAHMPIRLIVGAGFSELSVLRQAIGESGLAIEIVESPADMAACLAWATMAISAAGGTLWELSFLGLQVAAFSVVENQDDTAALLAQQSMIFGGQRLADVTDEALADILKDFLRSVDMRREYASRFGGLIDGLGASRVCKAILDARSERG